MVGSLFMAGCGKGSAEVSGQSFLKTKGGASVTCAGNPVYLEKNDQNTGYTYTKDLITTLEEQLLIHKKNLMSESDLVEAEALVEQYIKSMAVLGKSSEIDHKGLRYREYSSLAKKRIPILESEISSNKLRLKNLSSDNIFETICDNQGNFEFPNVEPGKYYIRTTVSWYAGEEKQGGFVSETITLKDGKNKVILTK